MRAFFACACANVCVFLCAHVHVPVDLGTPAVGDTMYPVHAWHALHAQVPFSSCSTALEGLLRGKRRLVVLNKADLVPKADLQVRFFRRHVSRVQVHITRGMKCRCRCTSHVARSARACAHHEWHVVQVRIVYGKCFISMPCLGADALRGSTDARLLPAPLDFLHPCSAGACRMQHAEWVHVVCSMQGGCMSYATCRAACSIQQVK